MDIFADWTLKLGCKAHSGIPGVKNVPNGWTRALQKLKFVLQRLGQISEVTMISGNVHEAKTHLFHKKKSKTSLCFAKERILKREVTVVIR